MAVKAATDRDIEYIISSAHASRPAEFAEFPRRSRCSSTAACATSHGVRAFGISMTAGGT
jgi:hypothetical protein